MIKLLDLLKEDSPFISRGGKERIEIFWMDKIQQYIKDGMIGNLNLQFAPITSLPDNLTVGRDLYLNKTKITKLPDNLTVGGSLYLYRVPITTLPPNLKIGGDLYLDHTPLSKNHSKDEIRAMVKNLKGENFEGRISI
ncbi:hypothetical protein UFOVP331_195 [uncultured Caudovirales phage]|uniref:Uncharacterized protein n=1 Tax=uncultured Caudovirales phage TaxID=2100421 RepID=A0A6J5LVY3_9CAUD|nr:hypothetical protein UFOVP331_195 [uncultured Caudovirales phage]